jgi:archaellum component FlaG (FlaF/FlaG flagellin family)
MKTIKSYFVLFVVLIVIAGGLYGYFVLGNQMRSMRGLQKGETYATKMYSDYSIVGENCQGEDSDNNGYVTCNFRLKKQSTQDEKTITLQCPTFIKSFMATSCKEQGVVINSQ